FAGAGAQIDAALQQPALGDAQRDAWLFQRERMRRMQLDFSLDRERAMAAVRRYIPDLREDEFR
ncbi:MAG TPA: transglutaminase, partial [Stenotrophomonas sp.]|nr:transglutaminase [Stenotrophomonas sp.]